jgi:putative ABC transport system permease protein
VAVLKALGFSGGDVLQGILAEAALLSLLGGAVGAAGAYALFRTKAFSLGFGPLSGFQVNLRTVAIAFSVSALVGVAAALLPAARAARINVLEGMRRAT